MTLRWEAADPAGVGYRVYESRNSGSFVPVEEVDGLEVTLTGEAGETLQVQVAALDSAGNEGPRSDPSETMVFGEASVSLAGEAPDDVVLEETPTTLDAALEEEPVVAALAGDAAPADVNMDDASVPVRLDLDGDGTSELLWESVDRTRLRVSSAEGQVLATFDRPPLAWELVAISDFDGDGLPDLLWAQESGEMALSRMALSLATQPTLGMADVGSLGPGDWIQASGDFDGDEVEELLVQDSGSQGLSAWSLGVGALPSVEELGYALAAGQTVAGSLDYDADGDDDVLLQGADGLLSIWLLDPEGAGSVVPLPVAAGGDVQASGDFDGDNVADVARRGDDGNVELLLLGAGVDAPVRVAGPVDGGTLEAIGSGDYDGDGRSDLLWKAADGDLVVWFLDPGLVFDTMPVAGSAGWVPIADWR